MYTAAFLFGCFDDHNAVQYNFISSLNLCRHFYDVVVYSNA